MYSFKYLPNFLALALMAILNSSPALADNFLPDVQQQGEIYYITGGIGDEETSAMQSERGDYNLQIMNADKQGHFSGYPHIIITDTQHNELLNADSGPLLYTNLPNGRYTVEGSSMGQTKSQNIIISNNKTSRIRFVWK